MADIRRIYSQQTATIPSGSSLASLPFDMRHLSDGMIHMSGSWDAADIGFKVSSASLVSGAQPLYDNTGSLVEITSPSADASFELPAELYSAHYVWIWSESSGTNVDQGGERSIAVDLKS